MTREPEPWFSTRVRAIMNGDHGIHHNGNDHRQGPLANCPRCVADGLLEELGRARHLAKHLFQMIPPEAWRDSGGDDGQGHYEGDYHAEQVLAEIKSWDANSHPVTRP